MGGMETWLWGEKYPLFMGCVGADGRAAGAYGKPKLDVAAADGGDDPQRPRVAERRV
jgi:hypothetical protein